MGRLSMAAPAKQRIVPAFMVEKLEGKTTKLIHGWDAKGVKTVKEVEVDAGFMVSFPAKGHSIHVRDFEQLKALGFDQTIPLVDADGEDDEAVGSIHNSVAALTRSK